MTRKTATRRYRSIETKQKLPKARQGKHHTPETKRKISKISKSMWQREGFRKKMSEIHKKSYINNPDLRRKIGIFTTKSYLNNPQRRIRQSEKMSGEKHPNFGKKASEETRRKIGNASRGRPGLVGDKNPMYGKTGDKNPFYGKRHTLKTKQKLSQANSGENSACWQGGSSFEPYNYDFNIRLKNRIRKRDNYLCMFCSKEENQNKQKLSIHHIDYNKENCDEKNLISLCQTCHAKTNYNRNKWRAIFTEINKIRYRDKTNIQRKIGDFY